VAEDTKESMVAGAEKSLAKVTKMADKTNGVIEETATKTKELAAKSTEAIAQNTKKMIDKAEEAIPVNTSTSRPSKPVATNKSTPVPTAVSTVTKETNEVKAKVKEKKKTVESSTNNSKPAPVAISHAAFDKLLRAYVSSTGVVDYAGLKSNGAALEGYINLLRENPVKDSWSTGEKLAYWINAYNAHTLKLILDNYPVQSIKDINGGKPWDKKWIKLGDQTYSLNNIENDIIRPQFKEPRIHFAVNCAAKSCPPLLNRAWTAENLEKNFEATTKSFINSNKYNQISNSGAKISSIFDWYGGDFGDVKAFINKYSDTKINDGASIGFSNYDWDLNGK